MELFLCVLEYMAIDAEIRFIQNANKTTLKIRPHRPEMLNLVFTQQKECPDINIEEQVNMVQKS